MYLFRGFWVLSPLLRRLISIHYLAMWIVTRGLKQHLPRHLAEKLKNAFAIHRQYKTATYEPTIGNDKQVETTRPAPITW
jgi:hypothetical protein